MIVLNIMSWQHFTQLDYIRKLPANEQLQRYNYYLMEQQVLQMQLTAQQTVGGGHSRSTNTVSSAESCIQFVADTTTGGSSFELTLTTVLATTVNITTNWGDNSTTQDTITGTGTISHTFPAPNETYNVTMCFDYGNNVSELIFTGTV